VGGAIVGLRITAADIQAKREALKSYRPHDLQRRLYRVDTQTEVLQALEGVLADRVNHTGWAAVKADLLAKYQASTTSVDRKSITSEVLDGTQKPTHRWATMGLDGWVDRIEGGANALFRAVSGAVFTVFEGNLEAIV
jgi:hypothetical protein